MICCCVHQSHHKLRVSAISYFYPVSHSVVFTGRSDCDEIYFSVLGQFFSFTFKKNLLNSLNHGQFWSNDMADILREFTNVDNKVVLKSHSKMEKQVDMFVSMVSSTYLANDVCLNILEPSILALCQCLKTGWKPQILPQV